MSLIHKSRHRKADAAIGNAHELIDAAYAQLDQAEEHNNAAAEAHHEALNYHSEQLNRTRTRRQSIQELKAKLP